VLTLTPSSAELVNDLQKLERQLKSFTAPSAEEQAIRDQLDTKRAELREQQRLESLAAAEHQRQQAQNALAEVGDNVKQADALVLALRAEMHTMQQKLAAAECRRNECLRNRAQVRQKLGVN
jgi:chromosome segregation ATPase